MRPVSFRGRSLSGEWIYGDLIQRQYSVKIGCYVSTQPTWKDPCGDTVYHEYEVAGDTVGQYTGLKDSNGKEIFEGDKLRGFQKEQSDIEGKRGFEITDTVEWRAGGFMIFGKNMQSGYTRDNNILYQFMWGNRGHHATPDHYYQIDDIEITGNVHDVNPPADSPVTHTMKDPAIIDPTTKQEEATNEQESAAQDQAMEVDSEEVTEG